MTAKQCFLKVLSILYILAMIVGILQPVTAAAQSGDGLKREVNAESGRVSFIGPKGGKPLLASEALGTSLQPQDPALALAEQFAPEFGLKEPVGNLSELTKEQAENGRLTVRYQQKYQGIPVMGGELIVNTNERGELYSINGEVSPDLSLQTQRNIDPLQARETALQAVAKWYHESSDAFTSTEPELWIFDESLLQPSTRPVELVWRMEVTPLEVGLPVRELVLVNAQRGSISLHFNQVDTMWKGSYENNTLTKHRSFSHIAGALTGTTWYVATNGNNTNNCVTSSTPCATVNAAVSKASISGDTIKVATGIYKDAQLIGQHDQVVYINKSVILSGGWDAGFETQNGMSTLDGNKERPGIRVFPSNGSITVTIERFIIQNGFSSIEGGGVNNYGTLTINDSVITENKVGDICCTSGSGGAGISNAGSLVLNNSTVSNNTILGWFLGSGIHNSRTLSINNSTISGNSGDDAIHNSPGGSISFNNSTVSHNTGGIHNSYGSIDLRNTIVAKNGYSDCKGSPITSSGYNLIGTIKECNFSAAEADLVGTEANPLDPFLNPLQNHGGWTPTHALAIGSPAIDTGSSATCLPTDQRGIARPVGAMCDIGAFEGSLPWEPSPLVSTFNANNTSILPGTFLCNQAQPNCTNNTNSHADAVHKYSIGTYNLYAIKHFRDSIDDDGMTISSTVQYCPSDVECPYDNAFWNGTQMIYGAGFGFALADDIVAHELTHGVTQYESNLFYYYQSGAINESLSDLWGEYYDQTNDLGNDTASVKWLIGEDVSGHGAFRSMIHPSSYGDPDKMTSTYYQRLPYYDGNWDNGGVHTNSGVNNKAVYLMVDGGTFNGRSVTSLGWDKVGAIYYEVQTNLLSSGADYSDLYFALQQACTSLIGQKGITTGDCAEVKDALDAVEMNAQPIPDFNTDASLCSVYEPVISFADDLENGTDKWSFFHGGYTRWYYDSPYGPYAHSGEHSLYADDYPQLGNSLTDTWAALTSFVVPNNAYMHFAHAYEFEFDSSAYYDGAVLEYSTNGGLTWADAGRLMEHNGYKGAIYPSLINQLRGRLAFVGSSHGYISTRLNLASLAGQTVLFRWRMGLDDSIAVGGWWLDDIKVYTCGPATIFADVPNTYWSWSYIEGLYNAGVTGGCSNTPRNYCPTITVTRDQMAVFLLRGKHGTSYSPPLPSGVFGDIPTTHWAAVWIERLAAEGITAGCGSGNYCPGTPVTRDQMAVFLLKAKHGSSYSPPTASGVFEDVPPDYWAAAWIERLAAEGITAGCSTSPLLYCPATPVTRDQMAVFLVRTFNLPTP